MSRPAGRPTSPTGERLNEHEGKITGVLEVEVEVEVLSITTSDESCRPVTFPQDGSNVSTVVPPGVP